MRYHLRDLLTRWFGSLAEPTDGEWSLAYRTLLDPATRTAKVRCTIKNGNLKLKPEMFATVVITSAGQKTLALQRRSVFRLGGKTVVFVQQGAGPKGEMRFERRPVQVDEDVTGDLLPVLSGIKAGEKVVVSGAILLAEMT